MNEHWAVFHKYESWSNFADHPRHVIPHGGVLSIESSSPSCDADIGTRKAARNDVNNASPWLSIKGLNVIPNRERRENSIILSGDKYASCVRLPFNGADCSPSKKVSPKYSPTSACEKSQLIQADTSSGHIAFQLPWQTIFRLTLPSVSCSIRTASQADISRLPVKHWYRYCSFMPTFSASCRRSSGVI
jgi:hypothetical protein